MRLFPEPSSTYTERIYLVKVVSLLGMEDTTFLIRFLPDAIPLHLDSWQLDDTASLITLHVTSTQRDVPCPVCTVRTHRLHSRYTRMLADLPWGPARVRWQLRVRKFFCSNPQCPRRLFTERLPGVVAPWARRTQRLAAWLSAIGLALGGAAGTRLSQRLGLTVSRNTLLRMVRRLPVPSFATPKVLGVDDFAFRKRQTYGTILIDLEHSRPVAILSGRDAPTLAAWLTSHPGVKVMARDRSTAYAEGARQGAPEATQVADRFHLLQNLAETLDQVFTTHGQALDAVNAALRQQPVPGSDGAVVVPVPPPSTPSLVQQRAAQRQARRQTIYNQIGTLHRQGWTVRAIAQQVGISQRTVQRDLQTPTFPGRRRRSDRGRSLLDPYKAALLERWNAGCRTAARLFRDLQQRGYAGSYALVAAYVRRVRQAQGLAPGQRRTQQTLPCVAESPYQPLTPRRATWLVLRHEEQRTAQ